MKVRVAIVQYEVREVSGFEGFATQCQRFVEEAGSQKADFVLFPEMLTCQLLSATPGLGGEVAMKALAGHTQSYLQLFTALAKKHSVNIVAGTHFSSVGNRTFNIAYLFHRDGSVSHQKKIHVTLSERAFWKIMAGDEVQVFDTDKGRVAIHICYDVEFPELSRIAVEKGAQILFVPYCTEDRQGHLRVRYCAQARCVENQVYVATAGLCGTISGVKNMDVHYSKSGIFTPSDVGFAPDGIAAECPENQESLTVQDLDLAALAQARKSGTVRNWTDRRTDLYQVSLLKK